MIEPRIFRDDRGFVFPSYVRSEFEKQGVAPIFSQDLVSYSKDAGVLRGLHYQNPPAAQGKLVRPTRGKIFDVAVDIRRGSPTFGRWASVDLDAARGQTLWIPPGFAHGFCALTPDVEVLYKLTHEWSPAHEGIVRWDDPAIGIGWPVERPILAPKDAQAPLLKDARIDFRYP